MIRFYTLFAILLFIYTSLSSSEDDLKLLSGDILEIEVYEHPDLKQTCRVSRTGNIKVSKSGRYSAFGKSAEELEKVIAAGFIKSEGLNCNL